MPGREAPSARLPWPVLAAAAFVFVFCGAYSYFVFDHVPHVHDEIAYLFQARIFLTGHFTAPVPCAPDSFDFPHMVNVGRWYSIYPPGFPALLAAGLVLGVPWLVNPLLGGLAVILIFLLGAEVYSRRAGLIAALLAAVSLWMLLMSSSLMSHTASMAAAALFLLFVFRSLRSPTVRHGLLAGLGLGVAILIRPFNAVLLAAPFLLVLTVRTVRELKARWKNALALALVAALAGGLYLAYNAATTGDPFKPGYIARYGPSYSVIFGRAATLDYDYTPHLGFIQLGDNMTAISRYLLGWPLTSLWPLLFTAWAWAKGRGDRGRDLLLASGFLVMLVGFFFFWGAFIAFGARMFFDAFPLLILLTARGLDQAPSLLAGVFRRVSAKTWGAVLAGCAAAFTVYAFAVRFPAWVAPADLQWFYDRYDHNLAGSSAWVGNAVRAAGLHKGLVVVKLVYGPLTGFPTGWWGSGFMHDTPRLDGDVIYANDRGPAAGLELARCFPGRALYLYWGTLERGALVPWRLEGRSLVPGDPVTIAHPGKREVELVANPERVFTLYSPGFRAFIEAAMRTEPGGWPALDATRFRKMGEEAAARDDYEKAAYALEAALQMNRDPRQRYEMLGPLTRCYAKTGQRAQSRRIMEAISRANFMIDKLGAVMPERGF